VADRAVVRLAALRRADHVLGFIVRLQHTERARIVNRPVRDARAGGQHEERDESGRSAKPGQNHDQVSD